MSEFQTHFDTPEAAYFGFFEADRAKNADAWAAVMSYPHVRVAATGTTDYFGTSRDYADAADWTSREATGWVRTVGREPVRLHESPDRVHLLGGWTRYNAKDEPILWNRVTYIVTRPGSRGVSRRASQLAHTTDSTMRSQPGRLPRRQSDRCGGTTMHSTKTTAMPAPDSVGFPWSKPALARLLVSKMARDWRSGPAGERIRSATWRSAPPNPVPVVSSWRSPPTMHPDGASSPFWWSAGNPTSGGSLAFRGSQLCGKVMEKEEEHRGWDHQIPLAAG